jgi:hypothetical protein
MRSVILKEISTDNTGVSLCVRLIFGANIRHKRSKDYKKILHSIVQEDNVPSIDIATVSCVQKESNLAQILTSYGRFSLKIYTYYHKRSLLH